MTPSSGRLGPVKARATSSMSRDEETEDRGTTVSDSGSREHTLPPLHEILGDLLVQPTSSPVSREGSSDSVSTGSLGPSRSPSDHGPRLPPIAPSRSSQLKRHASHAALESTRRLLSASSSGGETSDPNPPLQRPSAHSYDLFNYIPNQGLVHQRSSKQDDLDEPSNPKPRGSFTLDDSSRKYVCTECGRRFAKPSTLRNHNLTHTGEKPFACKHPGCGKSFSMASNMQRHMRTHTSASAFHIIPSSGEGGSADDEELSSGGTSPYD